MDLSGQASQARFASYVEALVEVIGHADRAEPLNDYCVGLLMPGERKSVEPMAAIVAPARVSAKHQSLLHLVGQAPWSDEAVLQKIRELVLPGIERQGRIEAWIVDDTGFTKKGTHSVGVARQYCGRLGKQDNCQVAVTLSIANHSASLPIAYRLYLPETWANDAARRKKTHVPKDIRFKTKPQIALDQIRAAHAEGVAPGIVLADAGYGANSDFRAGVSALNLPYVVGIQSTPSVWPPGQAPLPPKPEWPRPAPLQRAARRRTQACLGQRPGSELRQKGMAQRYLAGGIERAACFPLCRRSRAPRRAGLQANHTASGRMAARRMAEGRGGSHKILAFDLARGHAPRHTRRLCQTAVAHRT